jgi:hypothetical protein
LQIDSDQRDATTLAENIWAVAQRLQVTDNKSIIVAASKTLHHLLPDLVPPMDRTWTGLYFGWSVLAPQYQQAKIFTAAFEALARIGRSVDLNAEVGPGWRTSRTKVLDNAIIGYCKDRRLNA